MERREFLGGAAAAGLGAVAGALPDGAEAAATTATGPNILFILVDELRLPSVFPAGITTPHQFIQTFMPNLFRLWSTGVKFTSHFTAGVACTPARGCLITGLYTQQSWLAQTVLAKPYNSKSPQPVLSPVYPTYGKLLRKAGYQTPYFGKWHVSIPGPGRGALDEYGFAAMTYYDPTGANLQGTVGDKEHGYLSDADVAQQAAGYLGTRSPGSPRWCATVSFVNPHDKEFFWAGTEFKTFNALFMNQSVYQPFGYYSTVDNSVSPPKDYFPLVKWSENPLKQPNVYGYPPVPPNWEDTPTVAANKPAAQTYTKLFSQAVWGGINDDPSVPGFTIEMYPVTPAPGDKPYGVGKAPYTYWQRGLDCYTDTMRTVDVQIGVVLDALYALPQDVVDNTVVVFTSDHGEYAGAHGYAQGKVGSAYDEAYHVPLIVTDPSGRFAADRSTLRTGLTSSVDLLPMLVTIGYNGDRSWLTGDIGTIYSGRLDLTTMLRSSTAPGRDYVLLATDELVPGYWNFNNSTGHIVAYRSATEKLGLYSNWVGNTAQIDTTSIVTEFYDYTTRMGKLELENRKKDSRIMPLQQQMLADIIPNELQAPLPGIYGAASAKARTAYLIYDALLRNYGRADYKNGELRSKLGYGLDF